MDYMNSKVKSLHENWPQLKNLNNYSAGNGSNGQSMRSMGSSKTLNYDSNNTTNSNNLKESIDFTESKGDYYCQKVRDR